MSQRKRHVPRVEVQDGVVIVVVGIRQIVASMRELDMKNHRGINKREFRGL